MTTQKISLTYGKKIIDCTIIRSKRKTLEIAVHPDSSVIVTAPNYSNIDKIITKVNLRIKWIYRQLKYFKQFEPRSSSKQYLHGESHLYLGRNYRLKITTNLAENVKLVHGYFIVSIKNKDDRNRIKELLYNWYAEKAKERFNEYFENIWKNFSSVNTQQPILKIRKMKRRWGSLSKNGTLTLNIELIKAPKECIEYVITHELCHTVHHNHSSAFYKLLEHIMPDWKKLKHKLELKLS